MLPLDQFGRHARKRGGRMSRCRDCENAIQRAAAAADRDAVFGHYGRACACCGTAKRLTIDHVHGGGEAHRRALRCSGRAFYRWLIRQGFPPGFQTLCFPCNQSKGEGPACRIDHSARPGWKRCTGPCGRTLPPGAFYRNAGKRDGRTARCTDCRDDQQRDDRRRDGAR